MTRFFRFFATALVLALLMAGSVHAFPLDRSAPAGPTALLDRLQEWLGSLWTPQPFSHAWEEAGITMDPDGRDGAPPASPEGPDSPGTDEGITMDPDG